MAGLQLPETLGVMILPDCTLFPHGALPLRIFEERYKAMLEEALRGDPLFAIAHRSDEETGLPMIDASPIGTAGLIRACVREDDGSGQLILHGVIRVQFLEWLDDKPYPHARIEPVLNQSLPAHSNSEQALRLTVENYTTQLPDELAMLFRNFLDKCDDPHIFADLVCHHLLQDPAQRQELLETESTEERLQRLREILEKL